jgi:hypothetical protein
LKRAMPGDELRLVERTIPELQYEIVEVRQRCLEADLRVQEALSRW